MGCDIHVCAELRTAKGWVASDKYSYWNYGRNYDAKDPYHGRNYVLFGRLAGVRYGGVEPLDEPRGLPEDVSKRVEKDYERWSCDAHSASWFGLSELIAPGVWDVPVQYQDALSRIEVAILRAQGRHYPLYELRKFFGNYGWYARESRVQVRNLHLAQMYEELRTSSEREGTFYLADGYLFIEPCRAEVTWQEPLAHSCREFMEFLQRIKALRKDPEDVRIVFWFDN